MVVGAFAEVEEGELIVLGCLEMQMESPRCLLNISIAIPVQVD